MAGQSNATTFDTAYGVSQIAQDGVKAISKVAIQREDIMSQVKAAATTGGTSNNVTIAGGQIDISTGAGALVLDDALQELSTLEQAAAQLVAAENKAQKQVHSVTGQG
ncbi:hypothetical protein RDn1_263 [Candidatus Termititenax dinenymphae]|uniref:Uncharacterized protein n=1 Tax=Candidatus Termititenax dinenymphae TaxID=2218523 RepID=A0A388TLT5_9BACT|nr:hypothetical protein RDn1_263 [Candidatus Termititenax dinenymphae]